MTAPVRRHPLSSALLCAGIVTIVLVAAACAARPQPVRGAAEAQATRPSPRFVRGNRPPQYPARLCADRVSGHIIVEFSVDARGAPDTASMRVIEATHELFAVAVRDILPSWRLDRAGVARLPVHFRVLEPWGAEPADIEPPRYQSDPGPLRPVIVTTVP